MTTDTDIDIGQFSESLNDKADRDLQNLDNTGEDHFTNLDLTNLSFTGENHFSNPALTNSPYTTNRILEIPQDIKLYLNNGTLTLKAGSKVYVPNGFESDGTTPKFDVVTIENDITTVLGTTGTYRRIMCYNPTTQEMSLRYYHYTNVTTPDSGAYFNYNTSTNKIEYYASNIKDGYDYSLPIAYVHSTDAVIDTIEQTFNGFGYIGSTMFALPGVKVQIPKGKDNNGTNLYEIYTNDVIKLLTYTGTVVGRQIALAKTGLAFNVYTYDANKNKIYDVNNSTYKTDRVVIANVDFESGKVTSWQPYSVDSVANSNMSNISNAGRSYLSGVSMPSSKYINLTLGASGAAYTAPANGYFAISKAATANNQYINLRYNGISSSTLMAILALISTYSPGFNCVGYIPVRKGDNIVINYTAAGTTNYFYFIYAEGEE